MGEKKTVTRILQASAKYIIVLCDIVM